MGLKNRKFGREMAWQGRKAVQGKSGQMWFPDFVISAIIFFSFAAFFIVFLNTQSDGSRELDAGALQDAKSMSGLLVNSGYPENWTEDTVSYVGLTNGNRRINETKVSQFSSMDYTKARSIFGTPNDYIVFFADKNGNVIDVGGGSDS